MIGVAAKKTGAGVRLVTGIVLAAVALLVLAVALPQQARASSDIVTLTLNANTSVRVARGKPRTLRLSAPIHEIVVGDPEIADVSPLTDRSFYVLGQQLGTTGIALFDADRQLIGTVDIEVTLDTDRLAETIRSTVPGTEIRVGSANGRVVLSGSAGDAVSAGQAREIAARFAGAEEIIDSVSISSSQQVQLNVRFVEINRQVGQELSSRIGVQYFGAGGGVSFNSDPMATTSTPAAQIMAGLATGGLTVDVAIRALEDRGVARRLAEPNLIARSGQRASFLAGGEFPIPVAGDGDRVTIEYKRFGVSLEFTPTVLRDGLISLEIEPEVSSIDPTASYRVGNISVPGFSVRRASTSVDLRSGQSFMIAGLLQSQNDMETERVPGLGALPVLGALFSSRAFQRRETDLVIIITPHLVQPIDPSQRVATPLDGSRPATPNEYFLGNVDEVRAGALHAYAPAAANAGPRVGHILDLP